jgi:CRP/FNR family transcriptional regulator
MNFKEIYLFENLKGAQLKRLQEISRIRKHKRGEIIFFEGDRPRELNILTDGAVKVYKSDPKGKEVVINYFYPVTLVAELANLERIPYPASAVFETDGAVISVDYHLFEEEFLKNPDISFLIIKSLTRKLRNLDTVISQNLTMDATSRVAKLIDDNGNLFAHLKQNKIAAILNITPETMSRVMKKLKESGIIEYEEKRLKITDPEGLKELYE